MAVRAFLPLWLLAGVPHALSADDTVDPAFVAAHNDALTRARVWFKPPVSIPDADLGRTVAKDDGFSEDAVVECRFKVDGVGGSTPKFVCELPGGDDIKVKYGRGNAEVYTEVLATRLLHTLGFAADRMYPVATVRCHGCPPDPFARLQCLNEGTAKERCFPAVDYSQHQDFAGAVIERPLKGRRIETAKESGWGWKELPLVDARAGGSSRAEVDAFRLLAVVLAHWDNKPKNQRLLCADEDDDVSKPGPCRKPVAMIQDAGATFGPDKLNFERWSAHRVWIDSQSCRVSMRSLPYGGSSFPDVAISEDGRQLLAGLLQQLSTAQIRELFTGARVARYPHRTAAGRDVDNWVRAFEAKVKAIVEHRPCP